MPEHLDLSIILSAYSTFVDLSFSFSTTAKLPSPGMKKLLTSEETSCKSEQTNDRPERVLGLQLQRQRVRRYDPVQHGFVHAHERVVVALDGHLGLRPRPGRVTSERFLRGLDRLPLVRLQLEVVVADALVAVREEHILLAEEICQL